MILVIWIMNAYLRGGSIMMLSWFCFYFEHEFYPKKQNTFDKCKETFHSFILFRHFIFKMKNIFRTQNPVRIVGFRFTYLEFFVKNRTNLIVKLTAGKKCMYSNWNPIKLSSFRLFSFVFICKCQWNIQIK